jgi:hypothetical protein
MRGQAVDRFSKVILSLGEVWAGSGLHFAVVPR